MVALEEQDQELEFCSRLHCAVQTLGKPAMLLFSHLGLEARV